MDKNSFAIGILSLTATLLLVANYFAPSAANASLTIKDRDFSMVTARTQRGGDALYLLDNRSGKVAIYSYDPSSKIVRPFGSGDMANLFPENN
jgi:hypothetical protein